jgi:ribosomal 50S subunit-recycling heat shock protein
VVRGAAEVKPGEILTVRFAEDQLTVRVPPKKPAPTRTANDGSDG